MRPSGFVREITSTFKIYLIKRACYFRKWFQVKQSLWLSCVVILDILFGCHGNLILGKSPIKWRQRPDMTIAVDWDVKH